MNLRLGRTYKYLGNGGPGALNFIYVRPDIVDTVRPALSGWLCVPRGFSPLNTLEPARSIERMRVGMLPVIQLAALEEALKVWDGIEMSAIRGAP